MPCTISHGLLDAITNGGRGVAFLAPFSEQRYHFPVRPIEVSPLGVREFFTERGVTIMANELVWVWLPAALIAALAIWLRRRATGGSAGRAAVVAGALSPRPFTSSYTLISMVPLCP